MKTIDAISREIHGACHVRLGEHAQLVIDETARLIKEDRAASVAHFRALIEAAMGWLDPTGVNDEIRELWSNMNDSLLPQLFGDPIKWPLHDGWWWAYSASETTGGPIPLNAFTKDHTIQIDAMPKAGDPYWDTFTFWRAYP